MIDINDLRKKNIPSCYAVTQHGKNRLVERNIMLRDIIHCVDTGEIIRQYEDDKPFPSCLVLGKDCEDQPIHIVVSHDNDFIYLITAYRPDKEVWTDDFKRKREE